MESAVNKNEKRSSLRSVPTDLGQKITPQAIPIEKAVLGSILTDSRSLNDCIDILHPEVFYDPKHVFIFKAIKDLFDKPEAIDILTVTKNLRSKGELEMAGGPVYLTEITNNIGSTANIETHARFILEKYILRELIRISNDTMHSAFDETSDVFDILDKAEKNLYEVTEGNIKRNFKEMHVLMAEAIEEIEAMKSKEVGLSGVPSGFTDLDRITSGWQKSDMIIVAARPGMGKTSFVLSMARNTAVKFKRPVAVFSLEMSNIQLVNRLISAESGISSEKLRKGELREHEFVMMNTKIKELSEAPIYIDDTPAISIFELRAKCRRLKQKHNVELIIIDYLQLMTGSSDKKGNREQEISTISRSIKSIAKELNVPIIALSQLSRAVEQRGGDKRPQLSDLRDSGAIEQDADIVTFIYRPEYHGFDVDAEGQSTQGISEIIIAKHRNGSTGSVRLKFIAQFAKFDNLEENTFTELSPNDNFENSPPTVTFSSSMNNDENGDSYFQQ